MLVFQVGLIGEDADLDLLGVGEREKICIALRTLLADLGIHLDIGLRRHSVSTGYASHASEGRKA